MRRVVALAVVLAAGAARADVDWQLGRVTARGVGPADLRAPGPDIARVAAERAAEERWKTQLGEELRGLRVAGGGTLGKVASAEALDELVASARTERTLYSDGSVVVAAEVPIDRAARLVGAPAQSGLEPIVVDARKLKLDPAIGYRVRAGGVERTVLARFVTEVPGEPEARVSSVKQGIVTLDLDEQGLGDRHDVIFIVRGGR
jgi:hypothetical protein